MVVIIVIYLIYDYNTNLFYTNKIKKHLEVVPNENIIKKHLKELDIDSYINDNYNLKINDDSIIYIKNFLNDKFFKILKDKCNCIKNDRINLVYKSSSGISKFKLEQEYKNGLIEPFNLYYSTDFINSIRDILKKNINQTSFIDPTSCSIIIYDTPGDHINWHTDYNSYYGNRWTILITLVNTNNDDNDNLSSIKYCYKDIPGKEHCIKTEENSILIFNGSEVTHMATALNKNEKRVILSLTICDGCIQNFNLTNSIVEYLKYYIFYS